MSNVAEWCSYSSESHQSKGSSTLHALYGVLMTFTYSNATRRLINRDPAWVGFNRALRRRDLAATETGGDTKELCKWTGGRGGGTWQLLKLGGMVSAKVSAQARRVKNYVLKRKIGANLIAG